MIFDEESTNAMLLADADRMVLRSSTISGIYAHQCVAIYTVCHHAYLYLEQLNFIIRRDHKGRGSPPNNASICYWYNTPVEDNQT